MELNEILAIRLRAMMESRPDLDVQQKLHKRSGLSQSTIQRVLSRKVHTSLDVLSTLAETFGVSPLEMLKPFTVEQDNQLAPSYEEIEMLKAWRRLSKVDQHQAMAFMTVSALAKSRHHAQAREINPDSEQQIHRTLVAASNKASARKPGSETTIAVTKHEKGKPPTPAAKKRPGRTA